MCFGVCQQSCGLRQTTLVVAELMRATFLCACRRPYKLWMFANWSGTTESPRTCQQVARVLYAHADMDLLFYNYF